MSFPTDVVLKTSDEIPDDEVVYIDAKHMGFTTVSVVI